jgi:colanic acid/amylovoran biosynthesis protein
MKKVVIVIGAYCYNRGSEALAQGTIDIVKKYIKDSKIVLCSGEESFGPQLNIKNVDTYVRRQSYYSGFSFLRIAANICNKVLHNKRAYDKIKYKNLINECKDADLVIICGGDNYDKSYHMIDMMHSINLSIKESSNAKMVMYDCSLDAKEIDEKVKEDFSLFDAITAREMDTYNAFIKAFPEKSVYYFPDPAFVMEKEEVALPEKLIPKKTIGVNVSSMVTESQYGSNQEDILTAYNEMLKWILDNTDSNIMLIPHVMKNLDLKVLRVLYEPFKSNDRVFLIENEELKAKQLKYLISQCDFYVGARTHSTIAAYSSCVPTLVLGYSVKSIGIAKDLFGKSEGFVVPTKTIQSSDALKNAFVKLYENKEELRAKLQNEIMRGYIDKAWKAGEVFKGLLEEK